MNNKKYIILIFVIALVGFFSYVFFVRSFEKKDIASDNLTASSTLGSPETAKQIAIPADPPEGSIEYRNEKYSFSFYHSPEAKVTEYDQGQGAMIVTLENNKKEIGMQVFIVPYWEETISEERFKADVPSGVRTNIEKSSVDGVEAVTFNSVDENLGETREVWFIRGGYLYEVTTFKGVGEWFIPKMQSWKFL